ncbi:hypothetical protein [Reyranella soli]|uniref:Uncharacterized protein n=1 Tax=Reyranella soli TaxID=1230389 RepID=A0A512NS67_9HYPH|nr:hypothetical protein [Reyranella soli]GEP61762.1 hypothetical protein RSO01_89280 [Reyranella soli]
MGIQLRLPHLYRWVRTMRDPALQLAELRADVSDAKAEIRQVLDKLAQKHAIRPKDVEYAMDYADDMLSDTVYSVETALEREMEERDPV